MVLVENGDGGGDWADWRGGECLIPALLGKFYDQQQFTDAVFTLADGSTIQVHKLLLSISSPVFEGMFYGPMADTTTREFKVDDVKPVGFRRLIQFIYNSRWLSWKVEEPEEWWYILEAANKYMNIRLVEQVERKLRDISKKEAGKGVILKHLNMATRCSFETGVKIVFLNSVIKNTSKLIQSDHWGNLDEAAILKIYQQDFLAANEGELYVGAKNWCLKNSSSESEALKLFLDKFAKSIIPEYMSQRDFLTCVASDAFLAQVRFRLNV
ncbi:speckle-type POZ protein [Eurytemora carolleeae]|uniref:speckle-type POZ protein n=1 Tax=Eurytemora carolleeae TaxID=1294199 RepID=UPI000C7677C0|nr:speckle-type POZ protein [Eurytemora carolleeae]|eukprot:XP_023327484.1 speckle-type POZ protein-like [Eurytemora affinis]